MSTAHTAFFGEGEYTFRLTSSLIQELERKTGCAIGVLFDRIFKRTFAQADLTELVRLSLIGGGTAPQRAAELVASYVADRPLIETYPLAASIAEATWFGAPNVESKE